MTDSRVDLETWLILARRGQLTDEQTEQLDRRLRESPLSADLYRWGGAFDRVDVAQPGDEALIARAVSGAMRTRPQQRRSTPVPRKVRRWGNLLFAAVVIGSSATALGLVSLERFRSASSIKRADDCRMVATIPDASRRTGERTPTARVIPSEGTVPTLPSRQPPREPCATCNAATPMARMATPPAPLPRPLAPPTSTGIPRAAFDAEPEPSTAAELFGLANDARRKGDVALCIRRYRELERTFPNSPEAQLSHVSLGKVLQSVGDASGAVHEFTLYLSRPGALEEEALVGHAEGLSKLGQIAAERQSWQRLLARFPSSLYAARARERLGALGE